MLKSWYDSGKNFTIIDCMTPIHFGDSHLPKAKNIPMGQIYARKSLLPANKNQPVVFYGLFPMAFMAKDNARLAARMGYTNVYLYADGSRMWKKKGYPTRKGNMNLPNMKRFNSISAGQLKGSLNSYHIVALLPLKKKGYGQIPGTNVVPMPKLHILYKKIPRNKKILLYSLKSRIDRLAIRFLVSKGYKPSQLYFLRGGFVSWQNAGGQVVK